MYNLHSLSAIALGVLLNWFIGPVCVPISPPLPQHMIGDELSAVLYLIYIIKLFIVYVLYIIYALT